MTWWIIGGALAFVWLLLSVKFLGPREMGVWTLFGRPINFVDSGPFFAPFPMVRLHVYPRTVYNLPFSVAGVKTKEGSYGGIKCRAISLRSIDLALYFSWPQDKDLIDCHRTIPVNPYQDRLLRSYFENVVAGAVREVCSGMTWRGVIASKDRLKGMFETMIRSEDSPFKKAKIKDEELYLTITRIGLPEDLEQELSLPDRKAIQAEAAKIEAETGAHEIMGRLIRMRALASGTTQEAVQEEINANPELKAELLRWSEELISMKLAIDGKSFTRIQVEGAEGLEKMLWGGIALWKKLEQTMKEGPRLEQEHGDQEKTDDRGKQEGPQPPEGEDKTSLRPGPQRPRIGRRARPQRSSDKLGD